jgi:hypothetical protein
MTCNGSAVFRIEEKKSLVFEISAWPLTAEAAILIEKEISALQSLM